MIHPGLDFTHTMGWVTLGFILLVPRIGIKEFLVGMIVCEAMKVQFKIIWYAFL